MLTNRIDHRQQWRRP